jgi:hypothetical protein
VRQVDYVHAEALAIGWSPKRSPAQQLSQGSTSGTGGTGGTGGTSGGNEPVATAAGGPIVGGLGGALGCRRVLRIDTLAAGLASLTRAELGPGRGVEASAVHAANAHNAADDADAITNHDAAAGAGANGGGEASRAAGLGATSSAAAPVATGHQRRKRRPSGKCSVGVKDLAASSLGLVGRVYQRDFQAFGFDSSSSMTGTGGGSGDGGAGLGAEAGEAATKVPLSLTPTASVKGSSLGLVDSPAAPALPRQPPPGKKKPRLPTRPKGAKGAAAMRGGAGGHGAALGAKPR